MSNRRNKSDLRNWGCRVLMPAAQTEKMAPRHPTLAWDPPNRLTGAAVNERSSVFHRQAAGPFRKPLLGESGAFGMRVS